MYKGRTGRGVKLGTGKAIGELELTLANTVKPTKIVVKARKYNDKGEDYINVNGTEQTLTDGTSEDVVVNYDGNTAVSSINIKTTTTSKKYRTYVIAVTIYLPAEVNATYNWSTFSSPVALDFTGSDTKAYIVTAVSGSTLTLQQVNKVPANTGLLLGGTTDAAGIPVISAADATDVVTGNLLKAVASATTISEVSGKTRYVLSVEGGKAVFMSIGATSANVPAGKAYLEITGSGARSLDIEGETTGIENVNRETITNNRYYTLDGREVAQPTKGIYVVNGKKVVIR